MDRKERPGNNPFSDYERELEEYGRELDREFERFREELKNEGRAYNRMMAAFEDVGNARDHEEYDRKLREYERLSEEFDRISGRSHASSGADSRHKNDDKDEDSGLDGAWTITITTYTIPEDYLRILAIRKEIEDQIAREDKELGLDI
jgi:hypothetical protein